VNKILAMLAAPARELKSLYYPLTKGTIMGLQDLRWPEAHGSGVAGPRKERRLQRGTRVLAAGKPWPAGKVTGSSSDRDRGRTEVYRQSSAPPVLVPEPRRAPIFNPLLPTAGERPGRFRLSPARAGITGPRGPRAVETVTGPQPGEFKDGDRGGSDYPGTRTVRRHQIVWYAGGIGPVKIVEKTEKGTTILELEKTVAP